jgi:hypothetical protein
MGTRNSRNRRPENRPICPIGLTAVRYLDTTPKGLIHRFPSHLHVISATLSHCLGQTQIISKLRWSKALKARGRGIRVG